MKHFGANKHVHDELGLEGDLKVEFGLFKTGLILLAHFLQIISSSQMNFNRN